MGTTIAKLALSKFTLFGKSKILVSQRLFLGKKFQL